MSRVYLSGDSFARAMGADDVRLALLASGMQVTMVGTWGVASLEPVVEVDTENGRMALGNVTAEEAPTIKRHLDNDAGLDEQPNFLGQMPKHPYVAKQHRLVFDRLGNDPLAVEQIDRNLLMDVLSQAPDLIIEEIERSGLRGRGGAGFPAHIKWRTVANTHAEQKYIACNADEGDSGTFSDRVLMEGDPFRLIEGMVIAGYATGSTKGVIYLRSEYPYANQVLTDAIEQAYASGVLGKSILDSGFDFDLEIFLGAGAYICGEETSMLESLEGKRGQIRVKPPLPAISGLHAKPTLVHNVITLASVPGIINIGGSSYGDLGIKPSYGTMPFQLAGNVKHGGIIELPFGVSIRELVEDFGAGTQSGKPLRAVQIGGPLGAYLSDADLDLPLTYEAMNSIGAGIGHGGMVVFDSDVDLLEQARYAFEFCEIESCGKCTPCRLGATRGKELIEQMRPEGAKSHQIRLLNDLCDVMEKASLCQMGGMTPIPVRSALERFPEDFGVTSRT